jgi:hypothetical protein
MASFFYSLAVQDVTMPLETRARTYLKCGTSFLRQGNHDFASGDASRVIRWFPDWPEGYLLHGDAALLAGEAFPAWQLY